MTRPRVRSARLDDADQIARLMQRGVSELVRRVTIIGSPLLSAYVRGRLAAESADHYFVAERAGDLVGMSAWREIGDLLMLNHLYVREGDRGRGVGTQLVRAGLAQFRARSATHLGLDVFQDAPRARSWYRSWGMRVTAHTLWYQVALTQVPFEPRDGGVLGGLESADAEHARLGFSSVSLTTPLRQYTVGRLGTAWFRCLSDEILHDPYALTALSSLDPARNLLCLVPSLTGLPVCGAAGQVVAASERMTIPLVALRQHLNDRRRDRPDVVVNSFA